MKKEQRIGKQEGKGGGWGGGVSTNHHKIKKETRGTTQAKYVIKLIRNSESLLLTERKIQKYKGGSS